ncbi:MAG: AbiJ-NTD4 domain-containing protein [Thermoanaerobaculales bacterium]
MSFSQRQSIKPSRKLAQRGAMDQELRNGLWDMVNIHVWSKVGFEYPYHIRQMRGCSLHALFISLWHSFFKIPIDTMAPYFDQNLQQVRTWYFGAAWNEVYDLVEFLLTNLPADQAVGLAVFCNAVLERENAAYRIVSNKLVDITSQTEIDAVEAAIQVSATICGVNAHLGRALELLSDRGKPDYRNSIKESVSAVEALCCLLAGDEHATLGKALAVLESKSSLHGALKSGFSAIYGYTSDEGGIRHAMLDVPDLSPIDARFMLVACAAFVSFLLGKARELGISIEAV